MKIESNRMVALTYDLNVGEGDERELMEQATAERPLQFIFGANMMLDAFERELKGLGEGDTFSFSLTPEEAYGEYEEERVIELPKKIFEVDGKIDKKVLFEGNTLPMMDSAGNRLMGSVVAIKDDTVTMDFNHPLAGETMHFDGKVLSVREATAQEMAMISSGGCSDCPGCGPEGCG
ncbi:MAG: FKBP-type peptidyl-prolyl cis-trans isomerase [Bacteroidota bacterium]|jgi:FKBP-type peptidyl-prolyl cis-trans isomerase SlyD|nr:FKBP-type peptidyl-prolyl cis-trans isomerase [Bacteroidota bacterium]HHU95875.1 peptidylprolyl isomerase [Petrimonas sp.]